MQQYALLAAGLEIDSENAQMKEGLADARSGKDGPQNTGGGGAGGLFGPDFMAKLVRLIQLYSSSLLPHAKASVRTRLMQARQRLQSSTRHLGNSDVL